MKVSNDLGRMEVWNKFILDGNQDALSLVYFHYYDLLFDYGHKYTTDKQLVEDTIQDIFIYFMKHRKRIGIVKNLNGYLISTFRRQLILDLKKQKKTILIDQMPEEHFNYFKSQSQDISDSDNQELVHTTIKQCICKLTNKQQEIIFLRFEREISYEEIAKVLNISVDSCYKSIHRSIKTIRSEVEKTLGKGRSLILWFISGSSI